MTALVYVSLVCLSLTRGLEYGTGHDVLMPVTVGQSGRDRRTRLLFAVPATIRILGVDAGADRARIHNTIHYMVLVEGRDRVR